MATKWTKVPIEAKLYQNVHETALTTAQAALENAFINEADGYTRFPGLKKFVDFSASDNGRVYLSDWKGNLTGATSSGRVYRVNEAGTAEDVTGVPITGGRRVIFSSTEDELVMAAGGQIIRFAGGKTEVLSEDAPLASFVAFIDNYLVAVEVGSGRFFHSKAGQYRTWDPLDVFAADSKPDPINAMIVSRFRELFLCGKDSTEQYERAASGTTPFFRRWAVGEAVRVPYSVLAADNGIWCVNRELEFVRFSGQTSENRGIDIGDVFESIDDWTDAWVGGYPDRPLTILGQKFILFQAPHATNPYGTKGLTTVYDFKNNRWFMLYGWDDDTGMPTRWPGWSHWSMNDDNDAKRETYVGGEGVIYKIDNTVFSHDGGVQRMYGRTAHLSEQGEIRIDNLRAKLRRGTGGTGTESFFNIRAIRDGGKPTRWVRRGFGKDGDVAMFVEFGGFGCAHSWQFEWFVTDDSPVQFQKLEVQITPLGE